MNRNSIFCNNQSNNNINNVNIKKLKESCINKVHILFSTEGHIFFIDPHFHINIYKNENDISISSYNDVNSSSSKDNKAYEQKQRSCKYYRRK